MIANAALAVPLWLLIGLVAMPGVTFVAGRLLGARRGWVSLLVAGIGGWSAAVVAAGALTGWEWATADMVLVALVLGTLLTMIGALGLDLLAPMGSLARGNEAGLVTVANPLTGVHRKAATARRYRQVIALARSNGVIGRGIDHQALPLGVRRTLEGAGGVFVKLGQVASTRTDVLPAAWCEELSLLRSHAEPATENVMRPFLEAELGRSVDDVFADFDWTPIASASIAQVYAARLRDGRDVVVKVQRPGLDEKIEVDADAVLQLAGLIERRTPLGLAARPMELAAEFMDNVREELDFRVEAANGKALAIGLAAEPGTKVPDVMEEFSSRRVLCEERVAGTSIADADRLRQLGHDPGEVATRLLRLFLRQIFEVGVFHSDPHPGNILVQDDGTIVLIDLGAVGRLGPGQRSIVTDLVAAAASADASLVTAALGRMTSVGADVQLRELEMEIDLLLGRHLRAGGGISTAAFQDVAVTAGRFGLRMPRWFGTLARTLLTLEGTLRSIDPSFSLVDAAREAMGGPGREGLGSGSLRDTIQREAMAQLPRLRRLPERVDDLLGRAADGRLSAKVSLFGDPHNEEVVTRLVDRLVLGMIASSVGVGSVLLLGVESGPAISTSVSINEVLGYVGLVSSAVLALRLVAEIIRDGVT